MEKSNSVETLSRSGASHLSMRCLPMSHKKVARLIWVNKFNMSTRVRSFGNNLYISLTEAIFVEDKIVLGRLAWPGKVSLINILNTFIYVSLC